MLFNMGEGSAGVPARSTLPPSKQSVEPWIWPFFARLVASFGRTTTENARHALGFGTATNGAHPDCSSSRRELLSATLYLRAQGQDVGRTYAEFRDQFDRQIEYVSDEDEAALFMGPTWPLGAGIKRSWAEAERCFRKAP